MSEIRKTHRGFDDDPILQANYLAVVVRGVDADLSVLRRQRRKEVNQRSEELDSARRDLYGHLYHHSYTTAQVAELSGMSRRVVRSMAARGRSTHKLPSDEVQVLGFRTVRYGGYWFLKADIDYLKDNSAQDYAH